jgi:hypothetical protein
MTFHEAYERSNSWKRKIVLVSIFHKTRLNKDHRWTVKQTAKYFKISVGLCSENLNLSLMWDTIKECDSRNAALKKIKKNGEAK